jgi:hypothetical protein
MRNNILYYFQAWKVVGAGESTTSSTSAKAAGDNPVAAASTLTLVGVMQV